MEPAQRRSGAFAVVPMLMGFLAAQRAAPHVRTVDFVFLFFGGIAVGVALMGLIQLFRERRARDA